GLDGEHQKAGHLLKPERQLINVPGEDRRQGLRLVMKCECGEVSPMGVAAEQLDHSRGKYQTEREPSKKPEEGAGGRPRRFTAAKLPGCEENGQEAGLKQQA